MAKDKGTQPADKAAKAADDAKLKSEVASFAAELGLSAAAAAAADAFDDFAPEKAKEVIKAQPKPVKATTAKQAEPKQQGRQQKEAVPPAEQKQAVPADDDPIRSRTWNAGVGPRPGQVRSRSLQGRDEPNIWFEAAAALPALEASSLAAPALDEDAAEVKRQEAERLLEHEAEVFEKDLQKRNAADARWLQQVRKAGTTQDKIAAMTLLVQESAIANMRSLDGLLALFAKRKGGRQVVSQALEALQELFLTILLPDRKLKVFEQQPLQALPPGKEGERCLLFWVAEDAVKRRYSQFVTLLEETSTDQLDFLKERAIKAMHVLLAAKSEGEAKLLAALVNKLGDPNRKIASNAGFYLGQLLQKHPVMKPVVVREVERFVFRPALSDRARYYAVITLNQLVLSRRNQEGGDALAAKLIDLYFSLFALIMGGKLGNAATLVEKEEAKHPKSRHAHDRRKGGKSSNSTHKHPHKPAASKQPSAAEMDARMLSALIAGVRRAFPFVAKGQVDELIEKHSEALFRLIHTAPFSVALQALLLLYQLLSGREAVSDRFYRALYDVLLADGPFAATKAPMFMSLLYKAMRQDVHAKRVAAFAKRLLQVASQASPNWAAGALLIVSEALRAHPSLWSALQQPEDHGDEQERFRDITDSDEDEPTVQKRLPGRQMANGTASTSAGDPSDADDEDGAVANGFHLSSSASKRASLAVVVHKGSKAADAAVAQRAASGAHASSSGRHAGQEPVWPCEGYYDMRKREPLYAFAETSCWWELVLLASHAHPSVSAFARTLLSGVHVVYDGDPLKDLTLPTFLDKFVQRKPKSLARGSSLMQPLGGRRPSAQGRSAADIGSDAFAAMERVRVAPADAFFHKYYNLQTTKTAKDKKRKRSAEGSGGEEAGSDDFESDVSDTEADRVLTDVEGGGGGDRSKLLAEAEAGDYEYDALMGAMEEEGVSGSGEEEEEQEEGEAGNDGSSADDDDEEEEEESGDEGYVMLEEQPPGKRARTSKSGADFDITDAELEGVNILDLPSASSSDADEADEAGTAPPSSKRGRANTGSDSDSLQHKRRKGAAARTMDKVAAETGEDEPDIDDLDLDDIMDGSDGDDLPSDGRSSGDEGDLGMLASSSDEEDGGGAGKSRRGRGAGKDAMSDFASADDYAAFFDNLDKQQQQGDKGPAVPRGGQHKRQGTKPGSKHSIAASMDRHPMTAVAAPRKGKASSRHKQR